MVNKTISLSDEAVEVWKKRFGPNSIGFGDFSDWISKKLIQLGEEKYNINNLEFKREKLKLQIKNIEEELKNLDDKIKTAKRLEKLKYKLTKKEIEWFKETRDIVNLDPTKFYPRMKYYSIQFNKDVTEDEFLKLMDIALIKLYDKKS